MSLITNEIPFFIDYQTENRYNSRIDPSTLHASDTGLAAYFERYLIQKIFSCYDIRIPKTWNRTYFLYTLFCRGRVAVFETNKYGVIPQQCGLYGRDIYYQPTHVVITNPLIRSVKMPRIGTNCELIKMQPDYAGCWDIVSYYGGMLALCAQTAAVNLMNSKLSYVFFAKNKSSAETFKKMTDQIISGQPVTVIDKDLFDDDGTPLWQTFSQDLKSNYIAGDILDDMTKWDARFCTEVGIPNVNIAKASGVSASEVQANNDDTGSKIWVWYNEIKDGFEKVNQHYGLDLSIDLRYTYSNEPEGGADNGVVISAGTI